MRSGTPSQYFLISSSPLPLTTPEGMSSHYTKSSSISPPPSALNGSLLSGREMNSCCPRLLSSPCARQGQKTGVSHVSLPIHAAAGVGEILLLCAIQLIPQGCNWKDFVPQGRWLKLHLVQNLPHGFPVGCLATSLSVENTQGCS